MHSHYINSFPCSVSGFHVHEFVFFSCLSSFDSFSRLELPVVTPVDRFVHYHFVFSSAYTLRKKVQKLLLGLPFETLNGAYEY